MKFILDNQTQNDLELMEYSKGDKCIFSYFDYARSDGGRACLKRMFENPMADLEAIQARVEAITYLQCLPFFMEVRLDEIAFIEAYLQQKDIPRQGLRAVTRAVTGWVQPDNDSYLRQRAVPYLARMIHELDDFLREIPRNRTPKLIQELKQQVDEILTASGMRYFMTLKKDNYLMREKLDLYFRGSELKNVRVLLDVFYTLEALRGVGAAAKELQFTFPVFVPDKRKLRIEGLFHPFLKEPVRNDMDMNDECHLCFLTGPNMAGKSTYMKALGVAVYLAHCGFPVPAARMELSLLRGLFTTINLSDNLSLGYSHYYNEVARIKSVVQQVGELGDVFVVFDELFRGTNVKDAYDASLAVVSALARLKRGLFVISSHIVEVAEALQQESSVDFRFFELKMDDGTPRYTYLLRRGVSDERIGMYILRKEKVIDLIELIN